MTEQLWQSGQGGQRALPKWPTLATWPLPALLKLQASWREIRPETPEEHAAHAASMAELESTIAAALPQPLAAGNTPSAGTRPSGDA